MKNQNFTLTNLANLRQEINEIAPYIKNTDDILMIRKIQSSPLPDEVIEMMIDIYCKIPEYVVEQIKNFEDGMKVCLEVSNLGIYATFNRMKEVFYEKTKNLHEGDDLAFYSVIFIMTAFLSKYRNVIISGYISSLTS